MSNKNQVSLPLRTFLGSKKYSPLEKFLILLKLNSIFRANDKEAKERIWFRIKTEMEEK